MIYGKIWLVVKPSVGIPLFLGAVAITSLILHAGLLTQTTWFKAYWNGAAARVVAADPAAAPPPAAKK
jgi:light-harvesting protein B-800-850 alpha chain